MHSLNGNRHCEDGIVSSAHVIIFGNEVVPSAVNPHADRLLVQPPEGPLILPPFATGSFCCRFRVPTGHRSTGVANADTVLYVAAAPGGVWALPCATLEDDCPVAGAMHFAPAVSFHGCLATRIAAHLVAHAVGFTYPHMASRSMVRHVTGVRGGALSVVVHLTTAAMAAREHHDCDDIDGMELPDADEDGDAGVTLFAVPREGCVDGTNWLCRLLHGSDAGRIG
ncbi:surface protease GP63, putative [Trypanosoma cruzi marinkellei]|uniref:Leishmanolysin-like peptidase n=1 Tax=Trypanosoma cruzi marinkellei TaxID=85056 RepID=K2LW38_TRYCR|nr:surface protease GP63, putative [Trypanosoma cruzi marinkellei]